MFSSDKLDILSSVDMAARWLTIEPVIFLYMTAIMAEYTLIQHSIRTYHCFKYLNVSAPEICESNSNMSEAIKADAAISIGYYNGFLSLVCSVATLFAGAWSDSYGRKVPILLAIVSSWFAQILCIIFCANQPSNLSLIFAAGIVSGLSGSASSLLAGSFGYATDVVPEERRSNAMVILEAMLYLGESLGFVIGGYFTKIFIRQIAYGFLCLLGIHSALFYYVFILPESRSDTQNITFMSLFKLEHATKVFRAVFRKRPKSNRRKVILIIIGCAFLAQIGSLSLVSTLFVYLRNAPLYWTTEKYGYFNAFNILCNGITLLIIMPVILRKRSNATSDWTLTSLGFASLSIGLFYLSLVSSSTQVFFLPMFFIFKEIIMPTVRSMISRLVDDDERGKSLAFLGVAANVAFFVSSQLASRVYALTAHWFTGFLFQILSIISAIPLIIFLFSRKVWVEVLSQSDSSS